MFGFYYFYYVRNEFLRINNNIKLRNVVNVELKRESNTSNTGLIISSQELS